MKKYIIYGICFLLGLGLSLNLKAQEDFRKKAPAALPAPKIQLGNYVQNVLPNGLKVIVVENHRPCWRRFLRYWALYALVFWVCWGLMQLAPEPFLYWWRD